jgi:hypothetical protein
MQTEVNMKTIQHSTGLSTEILYELTRDKCEQCGVNFDYCLKHIVEVRPKTRKEFDEEIEGFLSVAYFTDYFELYKGFIPHRECANSLEEARQIYNEKEAQKLENLN